MKKFSLTVRLILLALLWGCGTRTIYETKDPYMKTGYFDSAKKAYVVANGDTINTVSCVVDSLPIPVGSLVRFQLSDTTGIETIWKDTSFSYIESDHFGVVLSSLRRNGVCNKAKYRVIVE